MYFTPIAARCYELMLERTFQRQTFGKFLYEHGSCREMIADSASDLEAARLLTLACAEEIDRLGARGARDKIAMIKVTVPELTSRVVDRAVQVSICPDMFTNVWSNSINYTNNPPFVPLESDFWRSRRMRRFSLGKSPRRTTNASHCRWARRCTQTIVSFIGAEESKTAHAVSDVMKQIRH